MGVWASDVHIIPGDRNRSEPWWRGLDGKLRRGEPFLDQIPEGKVHTEQDRRRIEDEHLRAKGVRHADGREDTTVLTAQCKIILPERVRESIERAHRDGKFTGNRIPPS